MKTILALGTALLVAAPAAAQQERVPRSMGGGDCAENVYNCADTPNPLPEATSVWIEELTWMDVRDALHAGKTTVIIPTGGMEPSGPWLATGKHNYVLRANCEAVARRLGNALCAPIVKYVPEGNIDPPSGHMASPGTISLRQESFDAMLTDIAHSLKVHGFRNIIFFGDSGGNQGGQRAVANRLNEMWDGTVVAHVQEYYDYAGVERYMAYRGFPEGTEDGTSDDPIITLNMFVTDPFSVRYDERVVAGKATTNGVSIADRAQSLEWAREIVAFRAQHTVRYIGDAIAQGGTTPASGSAAAGWWGPGELVDAGMGRSPSASAPDPRTMGGASAVPTTTTARIRRIPFPR